MNIRFLDDKTIRAGIVCRFFNRFATWKVHPQPEKWQSILINSCAVVTAWDDEQLVGFARAIGDQVRYAQVLDVLVHPDYRRMGHWQGTDCTAVIQSYDAGQGCYSGDTDDARLL